MKGIKLVAIVMAVMVIIGTMMAPAHADYEKSLTFEEKFEILFGYYLYKEGTEDYFEILNIEDLEGDPFDAYIVDIRLTDTAIDEIKDNLEIESDNVSGYTCILIWHDSLTYVMTSTLFVDGETYDTETLSGENILEDFGII